MMAFGEEACAAMGGVDTLINVVGIGGPTVSAEDLSLEDWQRVLDINLMGGFALTKSVIPTMKAQQLGCIINISSASVKTVLPLWLPYIVPKVGLEGLTTNLARELGPSGIRVNAIRPGPLSGPRMNHIKKQKSQALGMTEEQIRKRSSALNLAAFNDPLR